MNRIRGAIHNIHTADNRKKGKAGLVHPLSRLSVALFYVLLVVSFEKYDLYGLAGMVLYLLVLGIWDEISVKDMFGRIFPVLLLAGMVGIANPFFDRKVY